MTKQERKKPVFHEATEAPKPEFIPHQFGIEENKSVADDLGLPPEQNEDLDVLLTESSAVIEETGVEGTSDAVFPKTEDPSVSDVRVNGWRAISEAQYTGKSYLVSNTPEAQGGEIAFWRKTRALSNFKWVARGVWASSLTRVTLTPQPLYYKEV